MIKVVFYVPNILLSEVWQINPKDEVEQLSVFWIFLTFELYTNSFWVNQFRDWPELNLIDGG